MVTILPVINLYNVDSRRGDSLLEPQRYVNREWKALISPLNDQKSKIVQIAARIVVCALLIVSTLAAYLLGVAGILIKAVSPLPTTKKRHLDPLVFPEEISTRTPVPASLLVPMQGPPWAGLPMLPADLTRYILRLLPAGGLIRFMRVSKECHRLASSDILWEPALDHYGIRGPDKMWRFERIRNGATSDLRVISLHPTRNVAGAYEQVRCYNQLTQQGVRHFPDAFDYLARLIKGGPVGFHNIPELKLENIVALERPRSIYDPIERVLPEHMPASLMKGFDWFGRPFLALKLIDRAANNPHEFALVFVFNNRDSSEGIPLSCYHAQAGSFAENQIKFSDQRALNYILNLIKGEDFGDQIPHGFSTTVEIA